MAGEAFAVEPFMDEPPGLRDPEAAAGRIIDVGGQALDAARAHLAQGPERRTGNAGIEQQRGELEEGQAHGRIAMAST
jgi:hypothetical protein